MNVEEVIAQLSRIDRTADVVTRDPETGERTVVTRVYWTVDGVVIK